MICASTHDLAVHYDGVKRVSASHLRSVDAACPLLLQLQHQCDTFGGDSGSALWVEADGGFQIAAVHIGRPEDSTGYNLATKLNAAMRGFVFRTLLNNFDELTAMQYLG